MQCQINFFILFFCVLALKPGRCWICLQDIFRLIVSTFSGLSDTSGPSFGRRVVILETLAKYRSCVVMLDLECDDLVNEMFSTFFAVARFDFVNFLNFKLVLVNFLTLIILQSLFLKVSFTNIVISVPIIMRL